MIHKIATREMSEKQWQDARKGSIGGSDAAAIVGLNPYKSAYALWAEKSGKIEPEDIPALLEKGDRRLTGPTMPPQGLYLNRIWYEGEVGKMMEK